jgi:serine/threonine-protein kinase
MTDDPRIRQLLDEMLDAQATPEEVCRTCPELLPAMRARWQVLCRVRAELDNMFPPPDSPDEGPPAVPQDGPALPQVPGYEVEALLGRGGMGVVFRARHLRLNRVVALKMARNEADTGAVELVRFQREAEAVAALRHPNIVQVFDVGDLAGRPFLTMEFMEGGGLDGKLAGSPQPAAEAAGLVAALAGAVEAAHSAGIVHRDLKPSNVLLTADGAPKVGDFGLARRLQEDAALTWSGAAVGTPSYMAPEQARGKPDAVGPAADIYSLGAILYELLTGRPPFRAEMALETLQQVLHHEPAPPSQLNATVPRDLETICLKCLAKEPGRRYDSARALADDLRRFLEGRPVLARPMGLAERTWRWCRHNPRETGLVGLALLVFLLIVGGAWWMDRKATKQQANMVHQEALRRQGAKELLEQARILGRQARWEEAKKALDQAGLLIDEDGPEDLHQQLEQSRRDLLMVETLDAIAQDKAMLTAKGPNPTRIVLAYDTAFRKYGLAVRDESVAELVERIRGSEISQELVNALDDWLFQEPGGLVEKLAAVASAADPAPWRVQVRRAAAGRKVMALALLVETAPLEERSVPLLLALAQLFLSYDEGRMATLVGVTSHVGLLASPGGNGPYLGAVARISSGAGPLRCLRQLQQEHPDKFWVNFALGTALSQHLPMEAIRYYQGALAIRKDAIAVHVNLANVLVFNDRREEGIGHLRRAAELAPNNVMVRNNLGSALALNDQIDEAISQFEKVLRLSPQDVWGHYHLGLAFERKGQVKEALKQYQEALNIDPRFAAAQTRLLACLGRLGRLDKAIEHFEQALRKRPDDGHAHNHLGAALMARGRADKALGHFQQAIRMVPEDISTRTNCARCLLHLRRPDEALDQFRQAVALNPKSTYAQSWLRAVLGGLGRLKEARAAWGAALKADPAEHDAWYGYAEFCLFLRQEEEYRQARSALLRKFSAATDPKIAERTGRACLLLPASEEELRQAATLAERAASADQSQYRAIFGNFQFVRGLAEYRQGHFARAITTMRGEASRVLGPAPKLVLAMALHRSGELDEARKTLAAAIRSYDWREALAVNQDAWIFHALRREAERTIQAK